MFIIYNKSLDLIYPLHATRGKKQKENVVWHLKYDVEHDGLIIKMLEKRKVL